MLCRAFFHNVFPIIDNRALTPSKAPSKIIIIYNQSHSNAQFYSKIQKPLFFFSIDDLKNMFKFQKVKPKEFWFFIRKPCFYVIFSLNHCCVCFCIVFFSFFGRLFIEYLYDQSVKLLIFSELFTNVYQIVIYWFFFTKGQVLIVILYIFF